MCGIPGSYGWHHGRRQHRHGWPEVSGYGTGIPIFGKLSLIDESNRLRKSLTNRRFMRILLGTGVAPKKGYNDYGHPKTIQRKG